MTPVALTIAGSDPSGGAGIQADLKTFHQSGVYGEAVVTLVTVQNTVKVERVVCLEADLVAAQIEAVVSDIPPHAAKTGALGNAAIIEAVARSVRDGRYPLVVDPVMVSKHGAVLMDGAARAALARLLLPLATLVTPNLEEAAELSGIEVRDLRDARAAAERIADLGPRAILIKGGHLSGEAVDVLWAGGAVHEFRKRRIATPHTHGTGCTYSAAITAGLAKGRSLIEAVSDAKEYVHAAIETNPGLGRGSGPVNHHAAAEAHPRLS